MAEKVYEIAILGRVTWNMHSLSNEGTVGNVTEPRTIMLADGTKTDGISGEMLKHIHAMNLWSLENDKSKFCIVCRQLKPERADNNQNVRQKSKPEDAVKEAISTCELCDIHGFLVQKPTVSRESTVEFGWAVGIPNVVKRDIHVHARQSVHEAYVEKEKEAGQWGTNRCSVRDCDTNPAESKLYRVGRRWYCDKHIPTPQMLYHRPTRSGVYAIISVFQPWRIGLNNVNFNYDVGSNNQRKSRYQLALKAYQAMFLRIEGAMTATRLPHTENFEGVIVVSRSNYPVPVISPLKDDYIQEIEKINTSIGDSIEIKKFNSLAEFVQKINGLLNDDPYKLQVQDDGEKKENKEKPK